MVPLRSPVSGRPDSSRSRVSLIQVPTPMSTYRRAPAKLVRVFSSISCKASAPRTMPSTFIREEDQSPYYDPERYYPARVGEIICNRYRIISKLGWGTSSTVWLAKDTNRLVWASLSDISVNIMKLGVAVESICDLEDHELWQGRTELCL